ncbi:3-(methylthio)propanoyl-CoA dehydrogenase [Myxococcaceae bacterium]|jgi:alkylation response protein AidB-like acyl-CoA dehydrogenase|nr:3-(methylthio)propanoyl-CoA dehydrogenase [Myxococcaceae bacterium]
MLDYWNPAMRLYVDRLVDWETILTLRRGEAVDVEAEKGAFSTVLETLAALTAGFERPAREHWSEEAQLTPDGGAEPPAHMRDAYAKLREAGLVCMPVPEKYGGAALPLLLNGMALEMIARADASLMTVIGLQTGAAEDIEKYASEETKRAILPRFVSGEVQGCMDLTEPQAGSDLGRISARVTDLPDGTVRVDGQKIFITNGGAEVHLVLARDADTYDASKGTTQGLSLVLVERHRPDGSPNGVRVARLERKLGIHGSPTCEVVFEGAIGVRLGEKGKGFRAMLDLMNNARLGVAAQGLGIAEAAFHDATVYARQRQQFGQPIEKQPLVMTMLAKMAVNIEAARALCYHTYELADLVRSREVALSGSRLSNAERSAQQEALERDVVRLRLLTPLTKYFATEISHDITRDAMQILGGVGYTMDSDVPKLHADSLITTVYEGTSEIQASFALKEMGKGALAVVFEMARRELDAMKQDAMREPLADRVLSMIERVEEATKVLFSDIQYALLRAKLLAEMVIDVLASTELLRQVGADPRRLEVAESYVMRRSLEGDTMARRIEQNATGRLARDARVLELVTERSA